MITKTTKLSTILTAALISFAATSSYAEPKLGKTYGDWAITCDKNVQTKKTVCYLQQAYNTTDEKSADKKQVTVTAYQFLYSDKKELMLNQVLPQGAYLPAGTAVVSVEKVDPNKKEQTGTPIARGNFTVCQANICEARAMVSDADLKTILSSESVYIAAFNLEGKPASFPFSAKGLKEGLAALKSK